MAKLKPIAEKFHKPLWVDLEGRQVRVAEWTPFERGSVVLNRDFEIELPGKIFFRRAGWCEITYADAQNRKVYFQPLSGRTGYFLGKSQSVHVVAKRFEVKDYLGGLDENYIQAAASLGIKQFMLSFVESLQDLEVFSESYHACQNSSVNLPLESVLKIESQKGMEFVKSLNSVKGFSLMAARDDLFLSFVNNPKNFLDAVKIIVQKDSNAIVASRLMSGLEQGEGLTLGDMTDLALMSSNGYKNFMLSDELSRNFDNAMTQWENIALPILGDVKV